MSARGSEAGGRESNGRHLVEARAGPMMRDEDHRMTATDTFRRQHAELGQLAQELSLALGGASGVLREGDALRAVARLAGKLRVHAAMEDEALYPRLLAHPDPEVRAMAARFRQLFGGAYDAFFAFRDAWTHEAVARAPADFVREARALVSALGERIVHENDELYARVDALYPGP